MATSRKTTKKATARKTTRSGKSVKKAAKSKSSRSSSSHAATKGLDGWITHTELASANPAATKVWATKALGWTFRPSMPMPNGDYHLFSYSDLGGGGIRALEPSEVPHSTPTVHVADAHAAYVKALQAGAEPVSPPERIMPGVTIALVRAPGGVLIGLSGP